MTNTRRSWWAGGCGNCRGGWGSALAELEALAGALAAVLLALLHAAVARQVARVAQLLGHRHDGLVGRLALGGRRAGRRQAEHLLQRPGDALAARAGLAG